MFVKGISGNPRGRPRNSITPSLRKLAIPYRELVIDGLLALAETAENEHVRLAAWIEIANRSDGKPREAEDIEAEDRQPPSPEVVAAVARAMAGPV